MAGALKFWNGEEDIIIGGSGDSYSLPVAAADELGGVKSGGDVTIDADGLISVADGAIDTSNIANKAVSRAKLAQDAKSNGISVSLTTIGWEDNTQTVAVDGVTDNNNIIVAAASNSMGTYSNSEIYCSEQTVGYLTFVCGSTPTEDVTVNVIVLP
jgi:hypothetical protein